MIGQTIDCSGCGLAIGLHQAKFMEDCEFETSATEFRFFCPVCAIQEKNSAMQQTMLRELRS